MIKFAILSTVNYELFLKKRENFKIPNTLTAINAC